jgi:hypothetical protein
MSETIDHDTADLMAITGLLTAAHAQAVTDPAEAEKGLGHAATEVPWAGRPSACAPCSAWKFANEHSHDRLEGNCCRSLWATIPIAVLMIAITLIGDLTAGQRQRLLEIAERCPVSKTIRPGLEIASVLSDAIIAKLV